MKQSKQVLHSVLVVGLLTACSSSKTAKDTKIQEAPSNGTKTVDLSYMDKSVRPQDDFFQFANGTWIKENPIPASESRWGSFNELEQQNQQKLTGILEKLRIKGGAPGSIEEMLGNFYSSFMDFEKRNKDSWYEIKEDIYKTTSIVNYKDIVEVVADQHKNGINSLFGFGVGQDLKEVSKNILYFGQGGLGLPNSEYYTSPSKKEILDAYEKHVKAMFVLLGNTEESAGKSAFSVIKVESLLAEKMMTPAELRVPENSYNKMKKADFLKQAQYFDMNVYMKSLNVPDFQELVVGQPLFLQRVNEMITSTSIEVWKDYLMWKTLNHYAKHLDKAFIAENFRFYQGVLTGKTQMKPLNEQAINEITNMTIGESLGKLFVQSYYSEKAQARVNEMVDNLLVTFEERIKGLQWMSAETKKEALNKLKSIGRKLGFPSKWEDFSDLKLSKDNYLANIKLCNQRDVRKNFEDLLKPVDKDKWGMPAHMINAYYHPLLNEIAFPAGIMQAPFFDVDAEDAVNYGRIGMVIGHEFTHGFDDMGSKFAADGSFTNWWSAEDRKLFEERTLLLGNTFAGFCPIDGHCVNPELTMGENIADLGGITLAYYAYTKTEEFKSGKIVNGYTPAQRFFISFAQLWKINYTEAELKNRIANDPHSPGMYRVNGPLMNCPEFFEAFGVKENDKMRNSASKIAKIW